MKTMIEQFATFCAGKPEDEEYDVTSVDTCALGQFCNIMGWSGSDTHYTDASGVRHAYDPDMYDAAVAGFKREYQTFGALTTRLNEVLASQVQA